MASKQMNIFKVFDVVATVLLVVGGLNWGLVGIFGFDLVASIFGPMSAVSRLVYALVGISAIYEALMWKAIQRRWECAGSVQHAES